MKISVKNLAFGCLVLLVFVSFISSVSAITGSIGNARMVLKAQTGDKIEKYIKVINVNDVEVEIEVSASGELAKYIDIKDKKFILGAGEEKKAYFTINVAKAGKTESKINIKFTPIEGGNGVGLSSVVIVIAEGEDLEDKNEFDLFDFFNNNEDEEQNSSAGITGKAIDGNNKIKSVAIALSITGAMLLIFVVILVLYYIDKKRREEIKSKKRVRKR